MPGNDIRSFFMGGGKKKSEDKGGADAAKEDKAGVAAGAAGAKPAPAKSPKKAAAEVTKDSKDDKLQAGSKRGEASASHVEESPSKRARAAAAPSPAAAQSGGAVVQSKFFADSPTKASAAAAAAAAKKRKEQETVEVISSDNSDEDFKASKKAGKVAKVEQDSAAKGAAAEQTKQEAKKSPAKPRALPAWVTEDKKQNKGATAKPGTGKKEPSVEALKKEVAKGDADADTETPQKLSSPPTATPPTKKDSAKSSQKTSSQEDADAPKAEEAPKKKFNPWNQEKAEVPNKHLRDDKIAENRGKENCLQGMTFVITGVLDSMEREECVELIKSYGGKVTGGVSGKTSYLIAGNDAGESKLKKATEKKTRIIDEDGLFAIIKASGPPSAAASAGGANGGAAAAKKPEPTLKKVAPSPSKKVAPSPSSSAPGPSAHQPVKHSGKASASDSEFNAIRKEQRDAHDANLAPSLWVDKYAPNKLDDLMGNGDKRQQLRTWLAKWGSPSASSGAKQGGSGGGKSDTIHKAVLMHGPPGIGKSSSARVVIESCGYTMVELNASDVRNKAGLQEKVASLTQNQSISTLIMSQKKALQTFSGPKGGTCTLCGKPSREHFHGTKQQCYGTFLAGQDGASCHICGKERENHYGEHAQCYGTALVMDEVDGMSSGDRGGVAELIQIIKNSRVPIICIANDGYNQKIKSLKNYCLELKFSKPMHTMVVKRLKMIAEAEGFDVRNENALEKLYLSSGNDIRHVINALQTWRMRTNEIKYDDVSGEIGHGEKDASVRQTSPFDVVPQWFLSDSANKDKSFRDRMDMFFYDTDLMPLFVQENYAKVRVSLPKEESYSKDRGEYNIIRRMAEAAENISHSDLVNNQIRSKQNWALLPLFGNLSTISAGFPIRGQPPPNFFSKPGAPQLTFPGKVLGHQSTMGKKTRLAQDLARCMKLTSNANPCEIAAEYLPVLRHRLCAPLIADGAEGVEKTMGIMDEYLFSKEEFDVICTELRFNDIKMDGKTTEVATDWFGKVDSKVKAALTRGYNKESHAIKFTKPKLSAALTTKGKAKKGVGRSGEEKDSDDDYEEDAEDGEGGKDAAAAKKKGPTLPAKSAKGGAAKGGASKGAAKKPAAPRKKK